MKRFLLLIAAAATLSSAALAERAQEADALVNSVGINTHMTYTNTPYYSEWPQVLSALKAMHVRHVRDGFYDWSSSSVFYTYHQQLHAAGIDCDYVTGTVPTVAQIENVQQLAGDMAFIEAPNEADDQKQSNWAAVLKAGLPALYANATGAHVPVLGPSLVYQASYSTLGDIAADMTYNNLHIYFGGRNPGSTGWGSGDAEGHSYGSILWWLDNAKTDAPGVPSFVTETGYIANPTVTPYTLPQNIEAKYAPRTILEMFNAGIQRAYYYELLDEVSSPGYGMLTSTLTPKLAFTAISNLLGLLEDPGASFQPGVLNYTLTGVSSNVHHLLLQKRTGTYYLLLWIEASGYNEATNVVTPVAPQTANLTLTDATVQSIYNLSDQGVLTNTAEKSPPQISIPLSDTVTIVQINAN